MNIRLKRTALLLLLMVPALAAHAGQRDDYARQWPLQSSTTDAGAYRVTLDREVYRSVRLGSLRDVDIFNGQGQAVPAALFVPPAPRAQDAQRIELPWFPLPSGVAARADDIAVISERDADGRVRRVETRLSDAPRAATPTADAWLVDASGVRGQIVALDLDWTGTATFDAAYRVEGSDDLRSWRTLQAQAQLVDLNRDGRRLQQRRIVLEGQARYLRLLPVGSQPAVPLSGVHAELARTAVTQDWQWETLRGRAATDQGATVFAFELDGRFPVARVDVDTTANDAAEWTLESRDSAEDAWQLRAGPWLAYQVGGGDRSPVQELGDTVRDRHWRLRSRTPTASGIPTLRLGYRPEAVVYLAQGAPPFSLAAGSGRATRAEVPLSQLIDGMRAQRGADWQPAVARLGTAQALSGTQAYEPAPPRRDWKSWLLWALLVGGALVVTGLALSLLRKPAA